MGPCRAVCLATEAPEALETAANALPKAFPQTIVDIVSRAVMDRLDGLKLRSTA